MYFSNFIFSILPQTAHLLHKLLTKDEAKLCTDAVSSSLPGTGVLLRLPFEVEGCAPSLPGFGGALLESSPLIIRWSSRRSASSRSWDSWKFTKLRHVPLSSLIHPSKKVTHHNFNRLYQFVYGFVFIMLGIIWKLGYLSFHWCFICYDCFAGTCTGRLNWVQCPKINVANLDHNSTLIDDTNLFMRLYSSC